MKCNYFSIKDQTFYKPTNIRIKLSELMLKKKLLPILIELIVTVYHSHVCCDMTNLLLLIFGKLPSHCLIETNQSLKYCLKKNMAMKRLDGQSILLALGMVYVEICARMNVLLYCISLTGMKMLNFVGAGVILVHIVIEI